MLLEDDAGRPTLLGSWEQLPANTAFKNEPRSLAGHDQKLETQAPGTRANVQLPFIKFDQAGMVEIPESALLKLYVFSGFVDNAGAEHPFNTSAGRGLEYELIRVSKYTGRAWWDRK